MRYSDSILFVSFLFSCVVFGNCFTPPQKKTPIPLKMNKEPKLLEKANHPPNLVSKCSDFQGVKTVPPVGLKQGDGCIACHRKKAGVKQAGLVVLSAWVFCSAGILLSENADLFDHRIFEGSSQKKNLQYRKFRKCLVGG